jgi:3-phenylpropionate/cinnamic acid dioxygenase small subunit
MEVTDQSAPTTLGEVTRLLHTEARLLDERKFEDWMALMTPDATYWVPSRVDQADPWNEVSLMFDDLEIMKTRIARLRHPKVYAQLPHSRTVRQVSNIEVSRDEGDSVTARSVLFMFEHRPTLPQPIERIFAARCEYELRRREERLAIASKKVVLANCDAALESLFVYF